MKAPEVERAAVVGAAPTARTRCPPDLAERLATAREIIADARELLKVGDKPHR